MKLFLIGLLFLVNPCVNIIDVVPDIIGLLIIWFGLGKLRDLSQDLQSARGSAAKLMLAQAIKGLCLFWTVKWSGDAGFLLVFTMVFTIFELIYGIAMMSSFFNGTLFLGTLYDGGETVNKLTGIKVASILLFSLREIFNLLPELTYLKVDRDAGYIFGNYKLGMYIISVPIQLIVGIIWLAFICSYIKTIGSDTKFLENLKAKYDDDILPNTGLFTMRRIKTGFVLFLIGAFCTLEIFFDGINYLPGIISAGFFIASASFLKKFSKKSFPAFASSILYAIVCAVYEIVNYLYASKYYRWGIGKNFEAYSLYIATIIITVIKCAVLIAVVASFVIIFCQLVTDHTGAELHNPLPTVIALADKAKSDLRMKAKLLIIASAICGLSSVAESIFLNYQIVPYWAINVIVHILFFVFCTKYYFEFSEQLENKYF